MQAPQQISAPKTVAIDEQFDDWRDVKPIHRDTVANTAILVEHPRVEVDNSVISAFALAAIELLKGDGQRHHVGE
jgi:hypothetical protein